MVHHPSFLKLCRLCYCICRPDLEVDELFLLDGVLHLLLYESVGTIDSLLPIVYLCAFSPC